MIKNMCAVMHVFNDVRLHESSSTRIKKVFRISVDSIYIPIFY